MSFETDLDRYLTTPPEDNSNYFEAVYDLIPETILPYFVYDANEDRLDAIVSDCHIKGITVKDCANFMITLIELELVDLVADKLVKVKKF